MKNIIVLLSLLLKQSVQLCDIEIKSKNNNTDTNYQNNLLPTFRKCCPLGMVRKPGACVEDEKLDMISNSSVRIYFLNEFKEDIVVNEHFRIVTGPPCQFMYLEDDGKWYIQKDGNLYIELPTSIPPWTVRNPGEYCLDTFVTEENGVTKTRLVALVCFPNQAEEHNSNYTIGITGMLISCFFILLTVGVYSWLPELRNLHGRVLTAYLLTLFVALACLVTIELMFVLNTRITTDMCLVFAIIIYYTLLVAFFWLNVMCFDIWRTMSGNRSLALDRLSTRGRFNAYAAYAFGIPSAMTILLISLEFSGLPLNPYLPLLRKRGCFLFGLSKLLYFYGPITVLCLANMTFFVLTAIRIARIKQQTAVLQSRESATHDKHRSDKQRLLLYVKLFLIMGIDLGYELLEVTSTLYPEAEEVWKYTDAYSVLIGFTTFLVFVCKRKIFRLMKKRYLFNK